MTGPNTAPDAGGPAPLEEEQPRMMTTAIGTTRCWSAGVAMLRPSTALSTEIAGVMIAVPVEQRRAEQARGHQQPSERRGVPRGRTSASSARMPPSPRLSARMTIDEVLERDDEVERPEDQRQDARGRSRASAESRGAR